MKFVLIMNKNSYAGREYLNAISKSNIMLDVITVGSFAEIDHDEDLRCAGLWQPPKEVSFRDRFDFYHFQSLTDKRLLLFLKKQNYDIGLQGGTGILKSGLIDEFAHGILNFHPGNLPQYRGCSCPEWQLFEGKDIYCTCHFIDTGIDTGDICFKTKLCVNYQSYAHFRASIYPRISEFVVITLEKIVKLRNIPRFPQNEDEAIYRQYIGSQKIEEISSLLSSKKIHIH